MSEFLQPPSDLAEEWRDGIDAYNKRQAECTCKGKAQRWNREDDSGATVEYLKTYPDRTRFGKWWCVFQTHTPREDD